MVSPLPSRGKYKVVNWFTCLVMIAFHIGAVYALFHFSWTAFATAAVLYYISLSLGIGMGYHRLLTHRGYRVPRPLEYFLAVCGTLALEGGPIFWVAIHRIHHQFSDKEGDPHSPRDGSFWAHAGWILFGETHHNDTKVLARYAPDMARDRFYILLTRYHWVPLTLVGFALLAIGGWQLVAWGIFLRVTFGLHVTWAVNSATHMWGARRFVTRDDSRNNWWVAMLSFGEGWHNNHHAHPVSARHGLAWYELDVTYIGIKLMSLVGLARNIKVAAIDSATTADRQAAA
jgi:fatty-acid desaturase